MTIRLTTTLRENCGYLQDQGWHQTAQLMMLAANEIEGLNARIGELEKHLNTLDETSGLRTPAASNQNNGVRVAAVASRR